ncbi:protein of unknown function [Modestobacter italicus]|uniref:Uncharacterized protein n=1 Tax=Modestobacter italicus (strain DSM 44449 / CECT 9708 / BC 501) TaxID=2732864 RepID=I4EWZ5_MODI5|nr:hypothetical protein [Modestobacter marinus]CCH87908.1 protein of unknown function [Modestobacter marinus]
MPSPTIVPTAVIDSRVPAGVGSRAAPFPVARSIGRRTGDRRFHLVDGDGASLCEAFTQQQLERLALSWAEVMAVARCRACEMLGSPSGRP